MKEFAAYYPGVYTYDDTDSFAHPWFPKYNPLTGRNIKRSSTYTSGKARPANPRPRLRVSTTTTCMNSTSVRRIRRSNTSRRTPKGDKPFFMDVNFMKMHNPNIPAKAFIGKSHLGNYSDAMMELDSNIGRIMDAIRAEAPNTIVIITADNGAWQDAWPDAGTVPFRGEKGSPFEGGFRVPGIMWCARQDSRRRTLWRNDVPHRLLGNAGDDGRPHPAASRCMEGQ